MPRLDSTKQSSAPRTVDLPAADCPVSATRDPGATSNEAPSTAGRPRPGCSTTRPATARVGAGIATGPRLPARAGGSPWGAAGPGSPVGAAAPDDSGVPSTSRTRPAAACPSVLAWNSAPARRSGMKISGATSSTAMAVCSPSSPQSSRSPSTMATSPTPSPAMRSMESDDKNASRRVRMVATRTPSLASSTSRRPWASRPKARRVGRPSTSWRSRPASDPRRRHCRCERRVASRPKKIMQIGTARTSATTTPKDSRSWVATHASRRRGITPAAAAWGR